MTVRVVRSSEIGTIGVGEGTTPTVPQHLFEYLGIKRKFFYATAQPTWKIGVRLDWGPRPHFYVPVLTELDSQQPGLPMPNGYYCEQDFLYAGELSALMESGNVFMRNAAGGPEIHGGLAFHIENKLLVDTLQIIAQERGVEFIDAKVAGAKRGPAGIESVALEDGRLLAADFFVDASGFRSELLGKALAEPYVSYSKSLFCDRAIVGGWKRTTEPLLPYTLAETMDAGWCWQIEHEHFVNRGYVFASAFLSEDEARAEFLRKNPKAPEDARVVKFRSGRHQRTWVENVVGIGNAYGFVEPLEATALMLICGQCMSLCNLLRHSRLEPTPTLRSLYNTSFATAWDEVRDFLGLHYKLNTRLDNAFWRHCRAETDLSGIADLVEFYGENGPSLLARHFLKATQSPFGADGFLTMFVGNQAPFRHRYEPSAAERGAWESRRATLRAKAQAGMSVKEGLALIRRPEWVWYGDVGVKNATAMNPAMSI